MVHLRPFTNSDIPIVGEIWQRHHKGSFGLPALRNILDAQMIVNGPEVIGFGMVKLFAEGFLVLDKDKPLTARAASVIVGIEHSMDVVKRAGLEQFHVFTDDPHYIEVLRKHWGFRTTPETLLYREIE